jgi:diadenylate cyclase
MNPEWLQVAGAWLRPVAEILILAVAFYGASSFVRGTRGAPVVTGFLVVIVLMLIFSYVMKLEVLGWLLRYFLGFLAIAILIIFQPELRRILAELGTHPFIVNAREQRENIEVIIQSVARLSEAKIGALLAIEQSVALRDATESGIVVDCEATPEMIETIFFPNNAIHDGGVILRGDRIAYAATIFPLTQRQDLNKSLGTRHRAAIGLSEETDAIVIIVSEETGRVSYAYKGQLVQGVSEEALRAFLSSLLVKRAPPRRFFEWLRERFGPPAGAGTPAAPRGEFK